MEEGKFEMLHKDLGRAINSFKSSLTVRLLNYGEIEQDLMINGQIQKFEYNIELLWKLIKAYFQEKRGIRYQFPKDNIKAFFVDERIDEETYLILIDALNSRNILSHLYKETFFVEIKPKLNGYAKAIGAAYAAFEV